MTICTREKPLFFDLQSMLIVKENHASGSRITQSDNWMLYTEAERPRGRGGRGGSARNSGGRQEQERRHRGSADNSFGPSTSMGESRRRQKSANKGRHRMLVLWQEGPQGERVLEEARRFGENWIRIRANRTRKSAAIALHRRIGRIQKNRKGPAFVMRHEANSMKKTTPKSDEVWYVPGTLTPVRRTIS